MIVNLCFIAFSILGPLALIWWDPAYKRRTHPTPPEVTQ